MKNLGLITLLLFAIGSCTPKNAPKMSSAPAQPDVPEQYDEIGKPLMGEEDSEMEEYTFLEPADVLPEYGMASDTLPPYNPSHTLEHDLLHTKIAIRFDWEKKHALAKATLTLKPWFYDTDQLNLDAKNFDIHSITFAGQTEELPYTYDKQQLQIKLGRSFTRRDTFSVVIDYTAKPDEREGIGGSAAIMSDKGLYFINADGAVPDKPRQIWTQGETESNSCWFPTIDKPNERCTQEMLITVDDQFTTLSNGVMVSSEKHADGTRTDYWKMDKPHAPYLFMMAIGEFAMVHDTWRGIDVNYYVEPAFESYARDIFPYTPEMLEFFSQKLGYTYPWSKYSQVVVRDYVSGAMENTTGVIFGEFMQKTSRELLDDHMTNEKIVAHEMFHHWFGDLVTTESWANLTLNEGFANYSEYLWIEHKHGLEAADYHLMSDQQGYLYSMMGGGHPLIHYGYDQRESMFDAHSYNKGGSILHMLRTEFGDDAFFAGLNRYLTRNEYTDVEAHELRIAMEDVIGQDLNWFFNQWFFSSGHPQLEISYDWDPNTKMASVSIDQLQEGEEVPYIFELPIAVDVYMADGMVRREKVRMTKRSQTFQFPCASQPKLINTDAHKALLCEKTDNHSVEEWIHLYQNGPLFRDRWEALQALQEEDTPEVQRVFNAALQDKSDVIRQFAVQKADFSGEAEKNLLLSMAQEDPDPGVRASAIEILGMLGDKTCLPVLEKGMQADQPYSVVGAALSALTQLDPQAAIAASRALENDESESMILTLAGLYAEYPDSNLASWYIKRSGKVDYMSAFQFFNSHFQFLIALDDSRLLEEGVNHWKSISLNNAISPFQRFGSTKAIADLRNHYSQNGDTARAAALNAIVKDIIAMETDPTLKMYYGMLQTP